MKFFKDLFTEPDNQTFCFVRIIGAMGVATFFGLTLANYKQHAVFDPQGFALGFGGLIAGVGAALKMKKDTQAGQ